MIEGFWGLRVYLTGVLALVLMMFDYILGGVGANPYVFTKYKLRNA